jgi:hypothetical protein
MKFIRDSSPDEAVLVWLQAELGSTRFKDDLRKSLEKYGLSPDIITRPNLSDISDNKLRLKVLKNYRDWLEDDFYIYKWSLAELTTDDVKALKYIDYSYWNELSDNTHIVGVAAENIKQGKIVFNVNNGHFFDIANAAEAGVQFAPIVVLRRKQSLEIIEGHARATGYLLASNHIKPMLALIGSYK